MASFREILQAITDGLQDGLRDLARVVQDEASRIISEEAIDTGDLLHSDEIREDPFRVIVAWTADHAQDVNDGQRPHWPEDMDRLRGWVERNLRITPDTGEPVFKPRTREGTRSPREAEIDSVTYLVARKIAREGTDPVHFAERGIDKARPQASRKIVDAVNNRLSRL